jgi:hypothetical protein
MRMQFRKTPPRPHINPEPGIIGQNAQWFPRFVRDLAPCRLLYLIELRKVESSSERSMKHLDTGHRPSSSGADCYPKKIFVVLGIQNGVHSVFAGLARRYFKSKGKGDDSEEIFNPRIIVPGVGFQLAYSLGDVVDRKSCRPELGRQFLPEQRGRDRGAGARPG